MDFLIILFILIFFVAPAFFKSKKKTAAGLGSKLLDAVGPEIKSSVLKVAQGETKSRQAAAKAHAVGRGGEFVQRDVVGGVPQTVYRVPAQSQSRPQAWQTSSVSQMEQDRADEQTSANASEHEREHIKSQHKDREETGSEVRDRHDAKDFNKSRRSDWGQRNPRELITGESVLVVTGLLVITIYSLYLIT